MLVNAPQVTTHTPSHLALGYQTKPCQTAAPEIFNCIQRMPTSAKHHHSTSPLPFLHPACSLLSQRTQKSFVDPSTDAQLHNQCQLMTIMVAFPGGTLPLPAYPTATRAPPYCAPHHCPTTLATTFPPSARRGTGGTPITNKQTNQNAVHARAEITAEAALHPNHCEQHPWQNAHQGSSWHWSARSAHASQHAVHPLRRVI